MGPTPPRTAAPDADREVAPRAALTADRLLRALGAEPGFVDAMLGDLAEEHALWAARDGAGAARWWYAREVMRSTPHVVWSAIRHGGPRERARLHAAGAAIVLALTVATAALLTRKGPPARIVGGADAAAVVVNNVRPVQLPVQVLDAAGRLLRVQGVQYRRVAGAPVDVSPSGAVTCTQRGDATVRASLGPIAADVEVWCRPVSTIEAGTWISLVAGGPPRHLPFTAIGLDGRPVTQLRGAIRVLDAAIATLDGARVGPRAAGETAVSVELGDRAARIRVLVHEPVRAFTGLRPDQRLVAVSVRLARGDTIKLALPGGESAFWLKYLPRRAGDAPPTITLGGVAACGPGDGVREYRVPLDEYGATYCLVHAPHPSVTLAHGAAGAPVVEGWLALERVEHR